MSPSLVFDRIASKLEDAHRARSDLPSQLQQTVPPCARSCLESFVGSGYTCPNNDLSCLCSRYSSQGFTLGELAYGCSSLHCNNVSMEESTALYNICSAQAGAVQATHSTVTLPTTATALASVTTTTLQVTSTNAVDTSASPSASASTSISTTQPSSIGSSPLTGPAMATPTTQSTTSTTSPSPATTATHRSTSLTTAQAVGISVAAMGAISIAITIVFLVAWCKRRRASRSPKTGSDRNSYDFVDDAPPHFAPLKSSHTDHRTPLGEYAKSRAEMSGKNSQSQKWYGQRDKASQTREMSTAHGSNMNLTVSPDSRGSTESMRTVSQLLPDKPGTTPPLPLVTDKGYRPVSAFTAATVFEEHTRHSIPLSPALPPPLPEKPKPTAPKRPARPQFAPLYTTSPDQMRQPSLSLDIPRRVLSNERIASPTAFRVPPPNPKDSPSMMDPRSSGDSRLRSSHNLQPLNSAGSYLPNYYTSTDSRSPALTFSSAFSTPIENQAQTHRPIPVPAQITITKPTYPPKAIRVSTGSDTSFESTDPDEPTPPSEEEKQLSPVAESPISAVRYPKVPRSSNQTVPRSPKPTLSPSWRYSDIWPLDEEPRHSEPAPVVPASNPMTPPSQPQRQGTTISLGLSGSTLAAKRRGEGAAHSLERGLHINNSTHSRNNSHAEDIKLESPLPSTAAKQVIGRQESPLKGYGRRKTPPHNRVPAPAHCTRKPSYAGSGWGEPTSETPVYTTPKTKSQLATPKSINTSTGTGSRDVYIRSPLWEPKLTPSRRGEDLFLSVGVQTPVTPSFEYGMK